MRILQVHNLYQQPGGEDQVCAAEHSLLTEHGHTVYRYQVHNETVNSMSRLSLALKTIWNHHSYRDIEHILTAQLPEVIHVHNTFPLISPAVYYAAAAHQIPVVQTLHNYRLLCPAATLFRNGTVCEECVGSPIPYKSVCNRCYRSSAAATAAIASMLVVHRLARTWATKIDTYIALSAFSKQKFVEAGLPADKIVIKPNFLAEDPGPGNGTGNYALFVGRLSNEKGLATLVRAWKTLRSEIRLIIVGDGPLASWLQHEVQFLSDVVWLGSCQRDRVFALMKNAAFLTFPSVCYEGLPMTIIETLACGTPVVASALGSMNELIVDGVNGYRFTPGDSEDLIQKVRVLLASREELLGMRRSSRAFYEAHYSSNNNYKLLLDIYRHAMIAAHCVN